MNICSKARECYLNAAGLAKSEGALSGLWVFPSLCQNFWAIFATHLSAVSAFASHRAVPRCHLVFPLCHSVVSFETREMSSANPSLSPSSHTDDAARTLCGTAHMKMEEVRRFMFAARSFQGRPFTGVSTLQDGTNYGSPQSSVRAEVARRKDGV